MKLDKDNENTELVEETEMEAFNEVKEIALRVSEIGTLVDKLEDYIDTEGINWYTAAFVSLDKEDIEHFEKTNGVTESYFVDQWTGYAEDDYHGELYFKTDVPGQYVRVHFDM